MSETCPGTLLCFVLMIRVVPSVLTLRVTRGALCINFTWYMCLPLVQKKGLASAQFSSRHLYVAPSTDKHSTTDTDGSSIAKLLHVIGSPKKHNVFPGTTGITVTQEIPHLIYSNCSLKLSHLALCFTLEYILEDEKLSRSPSCPPDVHLVPIHLIPPLVT